MQFGKRLKKLRLEKGVSQSELAEKIYVSRSAVAKWENGLGLPNEQSLDSIADFFGVSRDCLLSNERVAIALDGNAAIPKSRKSVKVIVAICFACLIAMTATLFTLACYAASDSPRDGDSLAKMVGVHGEISRDKSDPTACITDVSTAQYPNAYLLEINKKYRFDVAPILTGGSTPSAFMASGVTLDYDKTLFDITLYYSEYGSDEQRSSYILVVKAECEFASIEISTLSKDYYGNDMTASVFISAA